MLRNWLKPNERVAKENVYKFRPGTTLYTKEQIRSMIVSETVTYFEPQPQAAVPATGSGDAMDTS